jgi:hypothetical protein
VPRALVGLGRTVQAAQRWKHAAVDAVIVPLLFVSYLTASWFIHSLGAFLAASAAITLCVWLGARTIARKCSADG